ncbi:MAG: hypothetical protein HY606_06665 [Planctomycetes bacterium]|nr:hypothetical protein [Planctomycetota bacterium]
MKKLSLLLVPVLFTSSLGFIYDQTEITKTEQDDDKAQLKEEIAELRRVVNELKTENGKLRDENRDLKRHQDKEQDNPAFTTRSKLHNGNDYKDVITKVLKSAGNRCEKCKNDSVEYSIEVMTPDEVEKPKVYKYPGKPWEKLSKAWKIEIPDDEFSVESKKQGDTDSKILKELKALKSRFQKIERRLSDLEDQLK